MPTTTIADIRQRYPQYADLSDEQLAQGLHRKHYADMPFDQFSQRIGLNGPRGTAAPQQKRSAAQELGRQAGLAARYLGEGAAQTVGIVADPIGATLSRVTGADYEPLGQYASRLLSQIGLPQPETGIEQAVAAGSRALVPGGAFVRGGQAAARGAQEGVRRAGEVLAARPGVQAASAVGGGAAAETARQRGVGPAGQVMAGVVGGLVPGAAAAGGPAAVRGAFRGGETGRMTVGRNIESFKTAGAVPTVGQSTERRVARGAESLAARAPGASGVMARRAQGQAEDIGAGLERIAGRLSPAGSAARAGLSVERGIKAEGGFVEAFKNRQSALYDALDEFVPKDAQIDVNATRKALDALSADIPGAPNLSQWFKNARISGIRGALVKDTEGVEALMTRSDIPPAFKQMLQNQEGAELLYTLRNLQDGTLPYEAVKKLRTLVGNEMADFSLTSDVPRSKWKALYAALSDDLGTAVKGDKAAETAWNRANTYTRAGMSRIEVLDRVLDKNGGPEAVFKAATSGTKEGAFVLRSVMQSLPKNNQKDLAAAIVRRLGRATASKQDETGGVFSTETFLTNWNNLSPEAKNVVFNRFGSSFRQDMDQVARVAANLREGSGIFANPSGTAGAGAQLVSATSFIVLLLTGQFGAASGIAGAAGVANLSARLMTNPDFVRWLARSTRAPVSSLSAQIGVLQGIASRTNDESVAELAELMQQAQNGNKAAQNQERR